MTVELLDIKTTEEIAKRNQRIANDPTTAVIHLRNTMQEHRLNSPSQEILRSINQKND
ncbi:MAG TPA: hypothetical protein VKA09_07485 [Nitrososphaeraceae archaeon]|nr:hypothetical protein [Nitrososphaeraceae archaeon]